MASLRKLFILLPALFVCILSFSQTSLTLTPAKIAVVAPLNLDSAFTGYTYKLSSTNIPPYFLSGLEFYNGAMMAIDSLQKENANIEVWVYDLHKRGQTPQALTNEMQKQNFDLVVASLTNVAEQKTISDYSIRNSVPVISATYPNNAAINYNPFFAIVNPTWQTHIAAIYNYLKSNYKSKKIIYFTKNNPFENTVWKEFQELDSNKSLLFKKVVLNDNFSADDVTRQLDSNSKNIVVCGSLNEAFGKTLLSQLNENGLTYNTTIIGMPTWYGMTGTTGDASKNLDVIITTPYNYPRTQTAMVNIASTYKNKYFGRPSDMVFKGFETMYHFTKLLLAYPDNFINKISDSTGTISSQFNFEAIHLSNTSFVPDYQENKKIYFIQVNNGTMASAR